MTIGRHVSVPYLSLELPARLESVGEARRRVRAFAEQWGATGETLAQIVLSVSEAAANAVVHGTVGNGTGRFWLEADVEDGELEVVVVDDGPGFVPDDESPGLGYGLAFVRAGALDFEIRDRPQGGVELWARFALAA